MSLNNPCNVSLNPQNTGVECQSAMSATAMLIMVPRSASFTQADITTAGSFTDLVTINSHLPAAQRWFPIFGFAAPINSITESNESDITETMDDGSQIFVRYGKYNRTFHTTSGGLCLAAHLMAFPRGYSFIEVDTEGKVLVYEPTSGTYKGVPTNMVKGLSPDTAKFKTAFKNKFMLSFDPVAYVIKGKIFSSSSDEDILGTTGLLDTAVTTGTATQTATTLFVGVETVCAETDLVALYTGVGAGTIGQVTNFVITRVSTGAVVVPTAVAVISGEVRLTGTFPAGTYSVALAAPSVLLANGLPGYEGITAATVVVS